MASAQRSTRVRRRSNCIARETANYRDNLATGSPSLWVVLRETRAEPPYALYLVTADPAEGEGMTEAGSNIVESVPMPERSAKRLSLSSPNTMSMRCS